MIVFLLVIVMTAVSCSNTYCGACLGDRPRHHWGRRVHGCSCPCRFTNQNRAG